MFESSDLSLDCHTCVAANTTACSDCVVHHLLANDDGPIELITVQSPVERAVALFVAAGLVGAEPEFVSMAEFESASIPHLVV